MYREIIITPHELQKGRVICKETIIPRNTQILLTGTITDQNNNPVGGAVIEVVAINNCSAQKNTCTLGYYITNCDGTYAIAINKMCNMDYQLKVYEQINVCGNICNI